MGMGRLRTHLLAWLLLPLLAFWVLAFKLQVLRSQSQADEAHDRALLGSAMVIAERVRAVEGRVVVDVPLAALAMLEAQAGDRVFWKILCNAPLAYVDGTEDLPPVASQDRLRDEPLFDDVRHNGLPLRMVALRRPLFDADACGEVIVQVGETTTARDSHAKTILTDALAWQLALIVGAAGLIIHGVRRGLAPLRPLRDEVRRRRDDDLLPVSTAGVPREVVPLVDAINLQLARQRGVMEAHRRFVADASHQLKTPLAVLQTQADLALLQSEPQRMRELVEELRDSTRSTARVVHQLLALLRSDPFALHGEEPIDVVDAVREASFELLPLALAKGVTLDFEDGAPATLRLHPTLLHELVKNLVDNAIHYTPAQGRVVVQAGASGHGALLSVQDSGPGIPPDQRQRVFERFYRVPGSPGDGCGLGLAIVHQIARRYRAVVHFDDAEGGGLRVRVNFPAADSA